MHSIAAGLVLLLALAFTAAASDEAAPEPFHGESVERWGTLKRIVEPEYPAQALAAGLTGYVDVEGTVTARQVLEDTRFIPGSPEVADFIAPLREVVPHWLYYAAIGRDCMPVPVRVATRVWFEIVDGKPRIRATNLPRQPRAPGVTLKATRKPPPTFPRDMLRRPGYQADVYAMISVLADGSVGQVDATGFTTAPSPASFEEASRGALSKWKYPTVAADTPTRRVCVQIDFRIRD